MGFVSAYDSMKPRQPQGSGADADDEEGTVLVEGEPSKFMFLGEEDPTPRQWFEHLRKHVDWAHKLATESVHGTANSPEIYAYWAHKLFHHLRIASRGLARLVEARVEFASQTELEDFARKCEVIARVGLTVAQLMDEKWRGKVDRATVNASLVDWTAISRTVHGYVAEYIRNIIQIVEKVKEILVPVGIGAGVLLLGAIAIGVAMRR